MRNISECTVCGEWMKFTNDMKKVRCPECGTEYSICADAEFVSGVWHDRTVVLPIGKPENYEKDLMDEKKLLAIGLLILAISIAGVVCFLKVVGAL